MIKLKAPSISLDASGTLADVLTFSKTKRGTSAKKHSKPKQPNSQKQIAVRSMISFLARAWKNLTPADQATWQNAADMSNVFPYHAYIAANARRWQNFRSPSKQDPAAETLPPPGQGQHTATGGVGMATIVLNFNPAHARWGGLIFRSPDVAYVPSLDTIKMVVPVNVTRYTTIVETPVPPGVWRYMQAPFTPDGIFALNTRFARATVT